MSFVCLSRENFEKAPLPKNDCPALHFTIQHPDVGDLFVRARNHIDTARTPKDYYLKREVTLDEHEMIELKSLQIAWDLII